MSGVLNIIFILISLLWVEDRALAQSSSKSYYGTYSHAPQGSTRAMALGGAYTGLSDDASGIIYNPAGLAFGKWIVDSGSTENLTINKETDIDDDQKKDGIPYQFQFRGLAAKWNSLAIAFGQSSPYSANIHGPNYNNTEAQLEIKSLNYSLAYQVTKNFSVGATYKDLSKYQNYSSFFGTDVYEEDTVKRTSYSVGVSYRPDNKIGFGLSYSPKVVFESDTLKNVNIGYLDWQVNDGWFRGAIIPEKVSFGGFFKSSDRFMYIADLDYVRPPDDMVYVESPFDGNLLSNEKIKTFPVVVVHGGIEYTVLKEKKRNVIWRAGGYREPARVVGGTDRLHLTMGVEVSLGPIVIAAAMDESNDFTNSTQSIGFSLGE